MTRVWLNGDVLDAGLARIAPSDRGFLLGDGAFETMRFETGVLHRWPRHRARLEGALKALEIARPDWKALHTAAADLCRVNALESAMVRLTVSRGPMGAGMAPEADATPTVLISARALPEAPVSLSTRCVEDARRDVRNLSSRFKLTGYADMLGARRSAQRAGADMALVLSADGHLSSADSANLFWVKEGRVFTPDLSCGCLPGTSRAALIDALKHEGRDVIEGRFGLDALMQADGAFVTNAVRGVVPLSGVDGHIFSMASDAFDPVRATCNAAL